MLLAPLAVVCGCGIAPKAAPPELTVVPLTWANYQGGRHVDGMMIVSQKSGTVTVCRTDCIVIGKVETTGTQNLIVTPEDGPGAYITNVVTGRVVACHVKSTDFAEKFTGGQCKDIGKEGQ